MEVNEDDAGGGRQGRNSVPDDNPNPSQIRGFKGKSCKGCLYYSSIHNSKSKNPTCVGFSRTLQQVPSDMVGQTELETSKEGRSLRDFKYACIGHSIYLDNEVSSADPRDKTAKMFFCVGLEVLLDKQPVGHVPAPAPKNEEHEHATPQFQPQPQRYNQPPRSTEEVYFNRFKRNASLVVSGCARNVYRVHKYIKETLDDIVDPYRRRPK